MPQMMSYESNPFRKRLLPALLYMLDSETDAGPVKYHLQTFSLLVFQWHLPEPNNVAAGRTLAPFFYQSSFSLSLTVPQALEIAIT